LHTHLRNRPLLGVGDADLFVEPAVWERLVDAISAGLNVLVVGSPGAGKTSLLRMVARREYDKQAVYVDLARASTAADALVVIADALGVARQSALAAGMTSLGRPARPSPDSDLLHLVRNIGAAPPTLLLIDEPPGGDEGHRLFGRLRDELWQLEHQWVVAASRSAASALQRPPANAFFEVRLELDALDEARQRQLLERRLPEVSDALVDGLLGRVELPRELITLARDALLEGRGPAEAAERIAAINEEVARLTDLERDVMTFVRAHGGTFSSDPALKDALAISQARLAKVLGSLADRGILTRRSERHGQGRPRTVYDLAPEYQA
jgi:AAA domain-containing protein